MIFKDDKYAYIIEWYGGLPKLYKLIVTSVDCCTIGSKYNESDNWSLPRTQADVFRSDKEAWANEIEICKRKVASAADRLEACKSNLISAQESKDD